MAPCGTGGVWSRGKVTRVTYPFRDVTDVTRASREPGKAGKVVHML
jgi:hypothetical protein